MPIVQPERNEKLAFSLTWEVKKARLLFTLGGEKYTAIAQPGRVK